MSEIDIIVPELKIVQDAIIDIPEFFKMMKTWLKNHRFYNLESEYEEGTKEQLKTSKTKLDSSKRVDDYTEYKIITIVKFHDQKPIMVETKGRKHKKTQCRLDIKIVSKIKSDYEGGWEGSPLKKFLRGVYDVFVTGGKKARLESELKNLTEEFYNELKAYLKLQQI